MERRAIFADLGDLHIWSGTVDEVWEGNTYKPGILLSTDLASGASLGPSSAPGLDVYLSSVPDLRSSLASGDEVELHVCRELVGVWTKLGGYYGIVDTVNGPVEGVRIAILPVAERATRLLRPRWSRDDYLSRYPGDDFFGELADLEAKGRTVVFP